ncbi:MAG: Rne/Rng family ribonuclease [Ornithinimicrobium sp.]
MSTTDDASATTPQAPKTAAPPPPASAGFGLVFQAPDLSDVPTRKPRPKAKAQERQPSEAVAGEQRDGAQTAGDDKPSQEDSPQRSTGQLSKGETPGPSDEVAPEGSSGESSGDDGGDPGQREGSSGNRRRKRGGKGRRGRGQGGDSEGSNDSAVDATGGAPTSDDSTGEGLKDGSGSSSGKKKGGKQGPKSGGAHKTSAEQTPSSGNAADHDGESNADSAGSDEEGGKRRRRRRRSDNPERGNRDEVTSVRGSTRLEAKRQRRNQGREVGRRRTVISEAEFLARRESVERVMVVRGLPDRTQIAVLEDGVPVEHYVSQQSQSTTVGNVYLGRVQNVLPSMEAAFVDIGKGRNAVLYAGEVNWDAAGLEVNQAKRIENALTSGESVLVQVTKDPIGHKGARLTSQVSLPGRFLVYVPGSSMTGISRKLPDTERSRLKKILKEIVPADAGVIVRTAAEGASEVELRSDVERLKAMWERIQTKSTSKSKSASGPVLLHSEPDMTVRVIRDVFNEDFAKIIVSGDQAWTDVSEYLEKVAPELATRAQKWTGTEDVFTPHRVNEALAKAMDRKVWLPSGGSLVIDRTEAMTVVDVNTGKFVGSGGNLEETVTKNNIEAAEEIVRQLRLRDIGGIIVIDFIDMVLESNRELVVRRLLECLGRDRTKHQVAEVTSLGLVQMTRKRVGAGLIEVFSQACAHCNGRGLVVHAEPVEKASESSNSGRGRSSRKSSGSGSVEQHKGHQGNAGHGGSANSSNGDGGNGKGNGNSEVRSVGASTSSSGPTPAQIAAAAHAAALQAGSAAEAADAAATAASDVVDTAAPSGRQDVMTASDEAAARPPSDGAALKPDAGGDEKAVHEVTQAPERDVSATQAAGPDSHDPPVAPSRPRRRRGRVIAPAGPPAATTEQAD